MKIIAEANRVPGGNEAWRRYADPDSYRELYGESAGDEDAGARIVYAAEAHAATPGETEADVLARFRAEHNVIHADFDRRNNRIPEPLPPRVAEVEAEGSPVPEPAVLDYGGLDGRTRGLLDGRGSVYPGGCEVSVLDTGLDLSWSRRMGDRLGETMQFTDEAHGALLPEGVGHFHGTHCAGIVAAGTGLKLNVGQVLADDGSGYDSWITDGIYWAIRAGSRVISMSLGGGGFSQAQADAVRYARSRGVLVVAAMGNDGRYLKSYPAAYPGAAGVIASHHRDSMRARFSNYGEWAHGTTEGVDFLSWGLSGALVRSSGTSMATPFYARGLALLIAEFGRPSYVLKALAATAADTPEPVLEEGHGRMHVGAALEEIAEAA